MKKTYSMLLLLIMGGLTGCRTYRPEPLTAARIDEALSVRDTGLLREEASSLHHPLLPPVEIDLEDGLSPDEAAILAVILNPSLRAVRDERALCDAQLLEAGLLPNPQVSGTWEPVTGGETAGTFPGYSFGLDWEITSFIARRTERESALAEREAIDLEVAWQEWQVAEAAKLAVYFLAGIQRQGGLAKEVHDRTAENLSLIRQAAKAGLMGEQDLSDAETAANQAQADWMELQRQARQQRLMLNKALGLPPDSQVPLQSGLSPLPCRLDPPSASRILAGIEERRLDLIALRKGYESQEAKVHAAVLDQFPKISIGVGRARDTSNVITTPFAVSIDLPLFDRNQAAIARERATRQRLFDEYVNRVFEVRSEITALIANAEGIEASLRLAQRAAERLQQRFETYGRAVDEGQVDRPTYYAVWNDLIAKRREIISLERQRAETRIAMEIAAGVYDLKSLKPPRTMESCKDSKEG